MTMAHLTTYLNDHLAGSVAALELLDHLIASQKDVDSARFFTELRTEVTEDQGTLEGLLHQLGGALVMEFPLEDGVQQPLVYRP